MYSRDVYSGDKNVLFSFIIQIHSIISWVFKQSFSCQGCETDLSVSNIKAWWDNMNVEG